MITIAELKKMSLPDLLVNSEFKAQLASLYNTCHRSSDGESFVDKETFYVKKLILDDKKVANATTLSMFAALMDLAYHGLSLEPVSKATAYLTPRSHNIGTRDNKIWEQRVLLSISAYGELQLRMRSGIIKYADNPIMVYEGDIFEKVNGKINHISKHISDVITHAYIHIKKYDGTSEYKDFSIGEILTFKAKADEAQQKSLAWTGGVGGQPTRGMIEAKVIKHSFSTYPRLRLGNSTILMTDDMDMEADAAYAQAMAGISQDEDEEDNTLDSTEDNEEKIAPINIDENNQNNIPIFKF